MRTPAGRQLANVIAHHCPVEEYLAAENEARLSESTHGTRTKLRAAHRKVMKHLDELEAAVNELQDEVRDVMYAKHMVEKL